MLHPGVDIAQWYCAPLPFKCPEIDSGFGLIFFHFFFFLFFFLFFRDTKINCSLFISLRSLYAHLPYHKTVLQRLPLFCKIHTNSASSENLCCSSILRFSMFSFSVAESSLTYIFRFRPLKQLISIKDRQQLKSKLRAYLICIKFTAHRSSDTFVHNSR